MGQDATVIVPFDLAVDHAVRLKVNEAPDDATPVDAGDFGDLRVRRPRVVPEFSESLPDSEGCAGEP
jgi:hypothetical protein